MALAVTAFACATERWEPATVTAIERGTARVYGGSNKAMYYTVSTRDRMLTGVLVSRSRFSDYRILPLSEGQSVEVSLSGSTLRIRSGEKVHKMTLDRERKLR